MFENEYVMSNHILHNSETLNTFRLFRTNSHLRDLVNLKPKL